MFFVRLTWSEMALPSVLSHLFGNDTLSQAPYPPGTRSSFCSSNRPTPFPALGLYKPAHPHVWKVLPHSFEASPSHILTFKFQLKCSIGREAPLPIKKSFRPTCQLYLCRPLYLPGDTITVCDDLFHLSACSLICYLSPQLECKCCDAEPLSALLTRETLSPQTVPGTESVTS